jgi:hypothetical protein
LDGKNDFAIPPLFLYQLRAQIRVPGWVFEKTPKM